MGGTTARNMIIAYESILQWVGLEGVVEFSGVDIDIETECLNIGTMQLC